MYFQLNIIVTFPNLGGIHSSSISVESDTASHVVIIHNAPSGEPLPEVPSAHFRPSLTHTSNSATDTVCVHKSGSTTVVTTPSELVQRASGTQSLHETDESVSSMATKSPRLSPQHSKGDVSRRTSSDHLGVSASGLAWTPSASKEDDYEPLEVQSNVVESSSKNEEGKLPETSLNEGSLTSTQSEKESVGTANSAERLKTHSPEPSCISGKTHIQSSKWNALYTLGAFVNSIWHSENGMTVV